MVILEELSDELSDAITLQSLKAAYATVDSFSFLEGSKPQKIAQDNKETLRRAIKLYSTSEEYELWERSLSEPSEGEKDVYPDWG